MWRAADARIVPIFPGPVRIASVIVLLSRSEFLNLIRLSNTGLTCGTCQRIQIDLNKNISLRVRAFLIFTFHPALSVQCSSMVTP